MKKSNGNVRLSRVGKKMLAGSLATSMAFGGVMTAFTAETVESAVGAAQAAEILAKYDFQKDGEGQVAGIKALNDAKNGATITADGELQFGAIVSGEAIGVLAENPFAGQTELQEDVLQAIKRDTTPINMRTYHYAGTTDKPEDYNRVSEYASNADAIVAYDKAVAQSKKDALAELQKTDATATEAAVTAEMAQAKLKWSGANPYEEANETYSVPMPVWRNGVTVSTWVKVPVGQTKAAVVYSFKKGTGAFTLHTDGNVFFAEGTATNELKRNAYYATYNGTTPLSNQGQWTYVTLTIKNDNIEVYYNGEKATPKVASAYVNGKTTQKTFNYGFGYAETAAARFKALVTQNRFQDILKKFGNTTDYDVTGLKILSEDETVPNPVSIIDFLTDESTELYLGGDDRTSVNNIIWENKLDIVNFSAATPMAGYSSANKGMMLDDISFETTPLTATEAKAQYMALTNKNGLDVKYDFAIEDGEVAKVEEMNKTKNNSKAEVVEGVGTVITLGAPVDPDAKISGYPYVNGIEVKNPFAKKTELKQTLQQAFSNDGTVLTWATKIATDGVTKKDYLAIDGANYKDIATAKASAITAYEKAYNEATAAALKALQDSTTSAVTMADVTAGAIKAQLKWTGINPKEQGDYNAPVPQWTNGVTVSTWVKVPESANQKITYLSELGTIFTFQNGTAGLALRTDGTVVYSQGGASNTESGRLLYAMKHDSNGAALTPLANKGNWTYVTLSIKNDKIDVYYDGVKATPRLNDPLTDVNNKDATSPNKSQSISSIDPYGTNGQNFNYGYGFATDYVYQNKSGSVVKSDRNTRINNLMGKDRYNKVLMNFDVTERDFSDFSKYSCFEKTQTAMNLANGNGNISIIDLLADTDTKFFIGGDNGTAFVGNNGAKDNQQIPIGRYTAANEGMQITDMSFSMYPMVEAQVKTAYMEVNNTFTTGYEAMSEQKWTVDEETGKVANVVKLNDDDNNSAVEYVKGEGSVLTLGELEEAYVKGVELANPFKAKTELVESIDSALAKDSTVFNAYKAYVPEATVNGVTTPAYYKVVEKLTQSVWDVRDNGSVYKAYDNILGYSTTRAEAKKLYDIVYNHTLDALFTELNTAAIADAKTLSPEDLQEKYGVTEVSGDSILVDKTAITVDQVQAKYATINAKTVSQGAVTIDNPYYFEYGQNFMIDPTTQSAVEYTSPFPVWDNGLSISTWVKVPAGTTDAGIVYTFVNGEGGFTLHTDGTVIFAEGTTDNTDALKNAYYATYGGTTPLSKAGQWTYVTLSVKNDNVEVYYDGVKATKTMSGNHTNGVSAQSTFNYGFGYSEDRATRFSAILTSSRFQDMLQSYGISSDYSDNTKLNYKGKSCKNLMQFFTHADTKLYIGGFTKNVLNNKNIKKVKADPNDPNSTDVAAPMGNYRTANVGMQIGEMVFYDVPLGEREAYRAYKLYENAMVVNEPDEVDPPATEEPTETTPPTDGPTETTPPTDGPTPTPPTETPSTPTPTPPTETPSTPTPTPTPPTEKPIKLGDIDGDGDVTLDDAQLALRAALRIIQLTDDQKKAANVVNVADANVDLDDAQAILRFALRIIKEF